MEGVGWGGGGGGTNCNEELIVIAYCFSSATPLLPQ